MKKLWSVDRFSLGCLFARTSDHVMFSSDFFHIRVWSFYKICSHVEVKGEKFKRNSSLKNHHINRNR